MSKGRIVEFANKYGLLGKEQFGKLGKSSRMGSQAYGLSMEVARMKGTIRAH